VPKSPSPRALSNTATLYRAVHTQDADAGDVPSYGSALASAVPCSVQPADPERFLDPATGRLIQKTMFDVYFRTDYALVADDLIVWVDNAGISHNLYVHGSADQAGKAACFVVSTEERL
jgi:hypothetical protein